MEAKFTPGPWVIKNHNGDSTYVGRYHDFSIMSGDSEVICLEPSVVKNGEDVNANAHLIAAAPDLYEKLSDAVRVMNAFIDAGNTACIPERDDAVKALSKARGESC